MGLSICKVQIEECQIGCVQQFLLVMELVMFTVRTKYFQGVLGFYQVLVKINSSGQRLSNGAFPTEELFGWRPRLGNVENEWRKK